MSRIKVLRPHEATVGRLYSVLPSDNENYFDFDEEIFLVLRIELVAPPNFLGHYKVAILSPSGPSTIALFHYDKLIEVA